MKRWRQWLAYCQFRAWQSGQGLVEYALILVFVAVVLIAILTVLAPGLQEIYQNIVDTLNR